MCRVAASAYSAGMKLPYGYSKSGWLIMRAITSAPPLPTLGNLPAPTHNTVSARPAPIASAARDNMIV